MNKLPVSFSIFYSYVMKLLYIIANRIEKKAWADPEEGDRVRVKLVSMWNKQLDPLGKSGTLWNLGKFYIVFFEINHFISVK